VSADTTQWLRQVIENKPYLGAQRLAWELQNQHQLQISPSTIKRLKRALRQKQSPPAAPAVWRFYERHHPIACGMAISWKR
jgi:hypothetical protein